MDKEEMTNEDWKEFIKKSINDALDARLLEKRDVLIPRKRTAELLDKDVSTLYRWEKSGYLRPVARRGRSVLYSSRDLERMGVIFD